MLYHFHYDNYLKLIRSLILELVVRNMQAGLIIYVNKKKEEE